MNLKRPNLRGAGLGSRLKASELKAPDFLADFYYDLRDRRLLPLVALVVVAIVAVPFLLGGDGEGPQIAPTPSEAPGAVAGAADGARLAVVESTPGLRDYRKRLHGKPVDPFVQRYTGVPATSQLKSTGTGGEGEAPSGGEPAASAGEPSGTGVDGGSSPGGSSPPPASEGDDNGSSGGAPGQRLYAYRPTIRFGVAGSDELKVYEEMPLGKLLPQEKPVMVFIGASEDGNRVAFNLTREVTWVRGPGKCVGGKEECSLLILRAGQAVDILTGSGRTFRLDIVKIEFVEVERPKPAGSSAAGGRGGLAGFQNFSK